MSCALFTDKSKLFEVFDEARTDIAPEMAVLGQDSQVAAAPASPTKSAQPAALEDDDDFLLYGNPTSAKESLPAAPAAIPDRTESSAALAPDAPAKDDKGPILAVVGTRLGELRIYEVVLHDLESPVLRFSCQALNLAPRLMTDTILEHKDEQMERKENPNDPVIKEVGIFGLGDGMRPLLVARLQSGQLLAYQAFLYAGQAASQRQKVKLSVAASRCLISLLKTLACPVCVSLLSHFTCFDSELSSRFSLLIVEWPSDGALPAI